VLDVLVLGSGSAGVLSALRAANLGARTALVSRGEFGGMAANDGPVPVRVDDLARIPLSFPTFIGIFGRAAASAARHLGLSHGIHA
jgi:phytoene dehydrogenase-like protein